MGSFGYIAGGALAGGGKAVEQFAAENMAELRMQKIEELRAQHQSQMQQSGQQFEHAERETAYGREVQAAALGRQFAQQQQGRLFGQQEKLEQEKSATSRANVHEIVQGRLGVQGMKNAGAASKLKAPTSEWSRYSVNRPGTSDSGYQPTPMNVLHHKSGLDLAEFNGRMVKYDGNADPKHMKDLEDWSGHLRNPKASDTEQLMDNPDTEWPHFLHTYQYLPSAWREALAKQYAAHANAYNAQGGKVSPDIENANEPATSAEEDIEDHQVATGGSPGGYDSSYANTGDAGPQATDTQPAQ